MKFLIFLIASAFLISTAVGASRGYPPRCPPNEVFLQCGTACEPSCQNPFPRVCTLQCITNVCQCAHGFVRGPAGCIRVQECQIYGK